MASNKFYAEFQKSIAIEGLEREKLNTRKREQNI